MDTSKILRISGVLEEYARIKSAEKFAKTLDQDTVRLLAKAVLEISIIPPLLKLFKDDPDYQEILRLVKLSFKTGKIDGQLFELYDRRKEQTKNYLTQLIRKLEKDTYGEKTTANIDTLIKSSRPDKLVIIEKIKKAKHEKIFQLPETDKRRKALEACAKVKWIMDQVSKSKLPFDDVDFKRKIEDEDVTEYVAYEIYDPIWEYNVFSYEEDFGRFPYKWAEELTPGVIRWLYELFKRNQLPEDPFSPRYDKQYLNILLKKFTDPFLPQIRIRERFIKQAFDNYLQENYAAAINLLLPIIEGIIWQHSVYLHNMGRKVYSSDSKVDAKSRLNFKLLTKSGEVLESDQTIKLLLTKTHMRDEIPPTLIEHFCEELYQERNLILHGIDLTYDTKSNCARKLFVLEHIFGIIFRRVAKDIEYFLKRAEKESQSENAPQTRNQSSNLSS